MKKKKTTIPKKHKKQYDFFNKIRKESDDRVRRYMKQVVQESNKNSERYIGIVAEEFQSQLKGVAENVSGLHEKVDSMQVDLETVKNDVGVLKTNVSVLKYDVEEIKITLRSKADLKDLVALDKRVVVLESK